MSSSSQPTHVVPPNAGPLAHYTPAVSAFIQSNATLLVALVHAHRADAARRANAQVHALVGQYQELRREYIKLKEERDELLVEVEKGKKREEELRRVVRNVNNSDNTAISEPGADIIDLTRDETPTYVAANLPPPTPARSPTSTLVHSSTSPSVSSPRVSCKPPKKTPLGFPPHAQGDISVSNISQPNGHKRDEYSTDWESPHKKPRLDNAQYSGENIHSQTMAEPGEPRSQSQRSSVRNPASSLATIKTDATDSSNGELGRLINEHHQLLAKIEDLKNYVARILSGRSVESFRDDVKQSPTPASGVGPSSSVPQPDSAPNHSSASLPTNFSHVTPASNSNGTSGCAPILDSDQAADIVSLSQTNHNLRVDLDKWMAYASRMRQGGSGGLSSEIERLEKLGYINPRKELTGIANRNEAGGELDCQRQPPASSAIQPDPSFSAQANLELRRANGSPVVAISKGQPQTGMPSNLVDELQRRLRVRKMM